LEDRRNIGENSCNSGDGTDQTGPIFDVDDDMMTMMGHCTFVRKILKF